MIDKIDRGMINRYTVCVVYIDMIYRYIDRCDM